ncbi:hypothetical protein [Fibrella forsythiae]|uniref:Uncharacterized protein n=1 Tax=Fibrella forsythiae TaxID=2817061 RepID=A0ABS3JTA9_9BACT|nr:hypothetical protein [Fibrella forsythiae]MBO0953262.1 hypothetical protein [Fibrella forsythiae]
MVQISTLPLLVVPQEFFSTDKILYVDILDVTDAPTSMRVRILAQYGGFEYKRKTYFPITLKGSPEKLFINLKKGVAFNFGGGLETIFIFDGKLDEALKDKKIYDFTKHYKNFDG